MAVDLTGIQNWYLGETQSKGETIGYEGGVTITYENGELLFTEADGDVFKMGSEELTADELEKLSKDLNARLETDGTEKTDEAAATTGSSADVDAKKAELAKLQGKWDTVKSAADEIKEVVEKLSGEIQEELKTNLEKQEQITKDEQQRIDEMVKGQIEQFKKDKEAGKDVSLTTLQADIREGMENSGFKSEMSVLVSNLLVTNAKMVQMDGLLTELSGLNSQLRDIDTQIGKAEEAVKQAEEEAKKCTPPPSCDPIGFTTKDEDGNQVRYDFIVDDGAFDSTSDFLGSEDGWAAMQALDADGKDGVSAKELQQGNVKAVKTVTDKDGNTHQEIVDVVEEFGEDFSIDLDSYKEGGSHSAVSTGDHDNDGVADQELLGTFKVKMGDQEIEGYNTLDDVDWLAENYNIAVAGQANGVEPGAEAGEEAEKATGERAEYSDSLDTFIADYRAKLEEFQKQFELVTQTLELDQELIDIIKDNAKEAGTFAAQEAIKDAEKEMAAEEAEEADDEDNVEGVDGAEGADNEEPEEDEEEDDQAA